VLVNFISAAAGANGAGVYDGHFQKCSDTFKQTFEALRSSRDHCLHHHWSNPHKDQLYHLIHLFDQAYLKFIQDLRVF
jgi:hypothetical protein